jgi:hypothetical protein
MRTIIKLIVAGLVVHATWRAGSAYWVYYQFRDGLRDVAQFSRGKSEQEIQKRAIEIASELDLLVQPEHIAVRRDQDHTFIDASYQTGIELLPAYHYPWEFNVKIDAWSIDPVSGGATSR